MRKLCSVEGCGKIVVSHGLCGTHRQRVLRHGDVNAGRPSDWGLRESHPLWHTHQHMKRTNTVCDEWKNDFWAFVNCVGERVNDNLLRRKRLDEPFSPDNFQWVKKQMRTKDHADRAAYMREYRKQNPDAFRNSELKRTFKIDLDKYTEMYDQQNGVCAICDKPETAVIRGKLMSLAVDHCHTSGKIRGLLCAHCNQGIGKFEEDINRMRRAIEYLRQYSKDVE